MLDLKQIRSAPKETEEKLKNKLSEAPVALILELDLLLRENKTKVDELKSLKNQSSKKIGELKQRKEDASLLLDEMGKIGEKISELDKEILDVEKNLTDILSTLPNIPMDDVPIGKSAEENVCIKTHLEKKEFDFPIKNHVELSESLDLFDFARGAKISGSGWPIYKGIGARLEWALLSYMLDIHIQNGFTQLMLPHLVKEETMYGSGQLPKFESQLYKITDEDYNLYLIPTAEVPLNGMHSGEILDEEELSLKYTAYTPCFRREAGAAGSSERGLIRTHQFNKVELFCLTKPEESASIFERMLLGAEKILEGLGLHYRNMLLSTGDMSFAAAKTVDIEVWLPGQNRYMEVSSVSNCTDFQARRSQIRFRRKGGKPEFVYTLNGSGLATSRLMVALLETNQQKDGSILVPKVLHKYLGEEIHCIYPR